MAAAGAPVVGCGTRRAYRIVIRSARWAIPAAYLVVYLIWGSTYLAIRFGIETMPPSLLFAWRFAAAGAINLALYPAICAWLREPVRRPSLRQVASASAIGCVLLVGGTGLVGWAERSVDSHLAALIISSTPLWVTLFDSGLRRTLPASPRQVMGMVLGVIGVAVLTGGGEGAGNTGMNGIALLLLATCLWSAASSVSHLADLPSSVILTSAIQMLAAAAAFFLIGLATGEIRPGSPAPISPRSWWAMWYLALFGSCLAFTAFAWLLTVEPAHRVASYALVNPFVAVALGAWLGHETIGPRVWIALPIISLGLALHLTASPAAASLSPSDRARTASPRGTP